MSSFRSGNFATCALSVVQIVLPPAVSIFGETRDVATIQLHFTSCLINL